MEENKLGYKNIYYPPGGILLWIIILLELITFGLTLVAMVIISKSNVELFHTSKMMLNTALGSINTIVLLTSGFLMAQSTHYFKLKNFDKSSFYLKLVLLTGTLFLIIKSYEFYHKSIEGITLEYNTFFTFYWLLTGFHFVHVLVGLVILFIMLLSMKKNSSAVKEEDFEASSAFWHMCDLIWLILFPVIYLIF